MLTKDVSDEDHILTFETRCKVAGKSCGGYGECCADLACMYKKCRGDNGPWDGMPSTSRRRG